MCGVEGLRRGMFCPERLVMCYLFIEGVLLCCVWCLVWVCVGVCVGAGDECLNLMPSSGQESASCQP